MGVCTCATPSMAIVYFSTDKIVLISLVSAFIVYIFRFRFLAVTALGVRVGIELFA